MANYTSPMPDYGDVFTKEEWQKCIARRSFIPYDGSGYWMRAGHFDREANAFASAPDDATHVAWFNK